MCGIWALLNNANICSEERAQCVHCLEARGPEYTACEDISGTTVTLGFTRLAINGLTPAGHQPFHANGMHVVCNGEIYNYKELASRWSIDLPEGTSDCAVIPALARKLSISDLCRTLDGVFAFVLVDTVKNELIVARDPYGVRPLFQATVNGSPVWSSEIKGFPKQSTDIHPFPPGTWSRYSTITGNLLESQKYHNVSHVKMVHLADRNIATVALHSALTSAVKKRLLSDRPIGALLSGGLDSSLVAALAARQLRMEGKKLTTFSIGMPGSTDLEYAQKVADFIGSIHHNIVVSPDDFLEAIPQVVHDIESYDITTVRASVGNWLLGKYIKDNTDIKVVFNGDGSDEIGGGYLYFYKAPSDEEFESESARLLETIHMYDVLRSDRSMASHGLEARTPFLDKQVVETWRAIATQYRRPKKANADGRGIQMEKQILRDAFANDSLLPYEVLYRKKEAFSDGVSSTTDSWYLRCATYAKANDVNLDDITKLTQTWHNPPKTEEAFWYRTLFHKHYSKESASIIPSMWMPRWIEGANDPSARTLKELY